MLEFIFSIDNLSRLWFVNFSIETKWSRSREMLSIEKKLWNVSTERNWHWNKCWNIICQLTINYQDYGLWFFQLKTNGQDQGKCLKTNYGTCQLKKWHWNKCWNIICRLTINCQGYGLWRYCQLKTNYGTWICQLKTNYWDKQIEFVNWKLSMEWMSCSQLKIFICHVHSDWSRQIFYIENKLEIVKFSAANKSSSQSQHFGPQLNLDFDLAHFIGESATPQIKTILPRPLASGRLLVFFNRIKKNLMVQQW